MITCARNFRRAADRLDMLLSARYGHQREKAPRSSRIALEMSPTSLRLPGGTLPVYPCGILHCPLSSQIVFLISISWHVELLFSSLTLNEVLTVLCCHPIYYILDAGLHISVYVDAKAGVTQGRPTHELHLFHCVKSTPPSFCGACMIFLSQEGSRDPFPSSAVR